MQTNALKSACGPIILLNGTSSAGKSTILKELLKLDPNFTSCAVDDWFPSELLRVVGPLGWTPESGEDPWWFLREHLRSTTGALYLDTELREKFFSDASTFYDRAKNSSQKGESVVIDTVFEHLHEHDQFDQSFEGFKVFKVLVYCPLDVLQSRVHERNSYGIPEELRSAFGSFEQFGAIYKRRNNASETVLDVIQTEITRDALHHAVNELMKIVPPYFFKKVERFCVEFEREFALNSSTPVELVSRHAYDLVLNSSKQSATDMAKEVAEQSNKWKKRIA